jgi:RHS repeat-associated protein
MPTSVLEQSYIGSQRIVSKLGDFASYGSDPRRIPYAGSEADAVTVDYKGKYASQQQVIKDNYATFNVPYNGEDNNDYVDGEGFCCNDGTPEAAQAKAMAANAAGAKAISGNFKENDDYEKMQFYYHPDHLGSSSYITNLDGEVAQHIEYVPFGEVFIEERNNTWNTPYLFNAKEFDEETGMYYYGARYYEPRLSLWMSVDRFAEKYPNSTPYAYCLGNPLKFTDINGDTLDVINSRGVYLFTLDNHQANRTNITAKDLYAEGIQWFESSADNYMPLLFVSTNIRESDSFTHFSWDDIISFSEVDRSMLSYRTGGSGDWKAEGNPGNGYLMTEVEGVPYWSDAIGQIPFTLNEYRNVLGRTKNSEKAAGETIDMGKRFGNGSLLNIFFSFPDDGNSYDNAIIKRSVDWAKNRYSLMPIRMPNGQYEIGVGKNDYSPNKMRVYTIKRGSRK